MTDYKSIIPEFFYKGECSKCNASTVGELKRLIAMLPDELPIEGSFSDSVCCIVYNVTQEDAHLEIVPKDHDEDHDDIDDIEE